MKNKQIPIAAAKRISKDYEFPEVVIFAYDPESGMQHVTTYGKTKKQCIDAATIGNFLKLTLGWPKEECNAQPSRAEKKKVLLVREKNGERIFDISTKILSNKAYLSLFKERDSMGYYNASELKFENDVYEGAKKGNADFATKIVRSREDYEYEYIEEYYLL